MVDERESYYYDGVRRVQERIDDDPNDPNSTSATREYVWGPGYVDEIVCQVDEQGDLLYYLQDANYNVVAVTDENGAVVAQYAYEPYGGVVAADTFTTTAYPDPNAPPINRIGHQGLFFERLYVDPDDPNDPYDTLSDPALSPPTDPNLATPLPGLYQVRNRVLIPNLGRFAQRDMNETALPIITALVMNAQAMNVFLQTFSDAGHYADGLNLYAFAGSNPITATDPLGLEWGIEDEIDYLISDKMGHALATVGALHEGAKIAALGMQTALGVVGSLLPGAGLLDLYKSGGLIMSGDAGFWDYLAVAGVATPAVFKAVQWGARMFKTSRMAGRARTGFAAKINKLPCNCFVVGTAVETPTGEVGIEGLRPDDRVLTRSEDCPTCPAEYGTVTRIFKRVAPVVVWLTLSNGQTLGTTPGHEVWTYEAGWGYAGHLSAGDAFLGLDGEPVTVTAIEFDPTPTAVYNLEVDGTFTYFAGGVWVHNNSCGLGSFNISDWSGYPGGVRRPTGPFVVLDGQSEIYKNARRLGNNAQARFKRANNVPANWEVHHIHPIIFGGDPEDFSNLIALPHRQHTQYSRFWRDLQSDLKGTVMVIGD